MNGCEQSGAAICKQGHNCPVRAATVAPIKKRSCDALGLCQGGDCTQCSYPLPTPTENISAKCTIAEKEISALDRVFSAAYVAVGFIAGLACHMVWGVT
jgi:hypothetical protein